MTNQVSSTESDNDLKVPNKNINEKGVLKSKDFKASAAAIITLVIGISMVAILQNKFGINDGAIIVTLLLVPLIMYGAISGRIKELTGPGGWGAKFNELEEKIDRTNKKVENQQSVINEAEGAAKNAVQLANLVAPREKEAQKDASPEDILAELVQEYNKIRDTQSSGSTRTMNMTAVVRKMIDLVPQLTQFNISGYLDSKNRGQRLAAYSYLYTRPNYQFLNELVDSVTNREDKPFGQYWGLQAILNNLAYYKGQHTVSPESVTQIRLLAERLSPRSDRGYVVRTILKEIE